MRNIEVGKKYVSNSCGSCIMAPAGSVVEVLEERAGNQWEFPGFRVYNQVSGNTFRCCKDCLGEEIGKRVTEENARVGMQVFLPPHNGGTYWLGVLTEVAGGIGQFKWDMFKSESCRLFDLKPPIYEVLSSPAWPQKEGLPMHEGHIICTEETAYVGGIAMPGPDLPYLDRGFSPDGHRIYAAKQNGLGSFNIYLEGLPDDEDHFYSGADYKRHLLFHPDDPKYGKNKTINVIKDILTRNHEQKGNEIVHPKNPHIQRGQRKRGENLAGRRRSRPIERGPKKDPKELRYASQAD